MTPSDPACHVCTNQEPSTVFCAPHALDHIRATHSPAATLLRVETTHGHIAIRTDPEESADQVAQRAEQAIANLATA